MGYIGVITHLLAIYYLPGTSKYPKQPGCFFFPLLSYIILPSPPRVARQDTNWDFKQVDVGRPRGGHGIEKGRRVLEDYPRRNVAVVNSWVVVPQK